MGEIQYIGEHLLPGKLGHLAIITAFVTSILGVYAYAMATKYRAELDKTQSWKRLGRGAFIVHSASIFSVIGILFYLMINQYYEYQYVWSHVSEDLPMRYIFSAFWEGQEGSFLLWMFWHAVLGLILMRTAKKWEAPTLSIMNLVQLFLVSMILGIYFGDNKIGANPLLLLRDTMDAPIFAQADYLSLIKGNGLNPLLQNYWMTIHPPTLFLGFASVTIPFLYAIAGLWTGEHKAWLRPALPWALFSGSILGTGILMGGAWAYEALSFGGYWAWDPVENMSLVPWLTLIAGIHTHLIARATGRAIRSTYIYYGLSFVLIIYSTFLTRSGVLGETSVHAFTEMGLEWQLIAFIVFFLGFTAWMIGRTYKSIPRPKTEESTTSREFWMLIGTLVLLFSAVIITIATSLPVFNKIIKYFDPVFEGWVITDPVPFYNKYNLWVAVFIAFLSSVAQLMRYRERNWKKHLRKFGTAMGISAAITIPLTWLIASWTPTYNWQYTILLISGVFATVLNMDYLIRIGKGSSKLVGTSFAHMGFGLMLIGLITSGLNKQIISSSPFVMEGLLTNMEDQEGWRKNMLLFKNTPMLMEEYELTYVSDTLVNYNRTYTVNFKKKNQAGEVVEEFNIYPMVQYNKEYTKIAASNPSTRHYLDRDIFTYISGLPEVEMNFQLRQEREDSLNYRTFSAALGETLVIRDTAEIKGKDTSTIRTYQVTPLAINRNPRNPDYEREKGDIPIGVTIQVRRLDKDSIFTVEPVIVLRGQLLYTYPSQIDPLSARLRVDESIFERLLVPEEELEYEEFELTQGQTFEYAGYQMQFAGFNKRAEHVNYEPEEGDIAVSSMISIKAPGGQNYMASPLFFIRDNKPYNLKDEIPAEGLHLRFIKLDPQKETAIVWIAKAQNAFEVPFQMATDSFSSNWIVLQAIEFPGINLFWLGTILMMVGLGWAMVIRGREKRKLNKAEKNQPIVPEEATLS